MCDLDWVANATLEELILSVCVPFFLRPERL